MTECVGELGRDREGMFHDGGLEMRREELYEEHCSKRKNQFPVFHYVVR
jgi:hypothetical protein